MFVIDTGKLKPLAGNHVAQQTCCPAISGQGEVRVMKRITLTEFLGLALQQLARESRDSNHCWLSEKPSELHRTFKALAEAHREILRPLSTVHFATAGSFPYSSELSRSLDLLQQAGMIRRENPSYNRFAPTWFADSEEELEKRKNQVFEDDPEAEAAFGQFVQGLNQLR
jgi:hypothetical protein